MLDTEEKKIVDEVLEDFAAIAAIPRPSFHEKAVSDYLLGVFKTLGCDVRQDAANNIIADRAASLGYESAPRVILQAHMDMVCVAEEGMEFDPLRDPIRLCHTEDELSAKGTSLGADDGAGIAMILYVFKHAENVGPLRAIITTDEETSMSGAQALEAKVFSDAAFLINWDSENFDELTRGCAGSVGIDFRRELHWCNSIMPQAWCVSVSGLLGGHSGERIGDGRGNAIRILAQTLHVLKDAGVSCSLASITGGSARNAIAAEAKAVLVTQSRREEILHLISDMEQHVRTVLGNVDPGICIKLSEVEMPAQVMEDSDMEALTDALLLLHTGVFQMSSTMPGLVETSANLGLIRTEGSEVRFSYFARSSVDEKLGEIADTCGVLGMRLGLETSVATPSPGWRERPQSELSDIMATIFEEQNGRPMKVGVIHAGLECGWHIKKAPHLDMVSIGVTTHDIHSPKERLDLKTVVPQVRLVMETLHKIAQGK